MTDEEVITLELWGEFFNLNPDQDIFDYFGEHYQGYLPGLVERTLFVRQAANLGQVKAAIQQWLTLISGQANDPVQIIDTLPLPGCVYRPAYRDRCFKPQADYGHWAAKKLDYYGFNLGLRGARSGMIPSVPLLPARPHEVQVLEEWVEDFVETVPADKGFIDAFRQTLLAEPQGVLVVTPPRQGMTTPHPPKLLRACQYLRNRVETVASQLSDRFAIAHLRVRDGWHYQHRLIRKVLAQTVGVFLNLQLARKPLDLDGLLP